MYKTRFDSQEMILNAFLKQKQIEKILIALALFWFWL